jgi:hypothetical protein
MFNKLLNYIKVFGLAVELTAIIFIILISSLVFFLLSFVKFVLILMFMFEFLPFSSIYNFKMEYIIICGINSFINNVGNSPNITVF